MPRQLSATSPDTTTSPDSTTSPDMTTSPSPRTRHALAGTLLLLIPFCIFALYFSVDYVTRSWRLLESSPNPGGLPRYPIKTVILVGFSMLLLQGISEVIKRVAWLRGVPGVPGPGDDDMRRKAAEGEA